MDILTFFALLRHDFGTILTSSLALFIVICADFLNYYQCVCSPLTLGQGKSTDGLRSDFESFFQDLFQSYVAIFRQKKSTKPPFRGRTVLQSSILIFLPSFLKCHNLLITAPVTFSNNDKVNLK